MTLKLRIDNRDYPVLTASEHASETGNHQIHSLSLPWEAPFAGSFHKVELVADQEVHAIRVVASRFQEGAQRVSFRFAAALA